MRTKTWGAALVALTLGLAGPAGAQTSSTVSDKDWGAFAKLAGREFLQDGTTTRLKFVVIDPRTIVLQSNSYSLGQVVGCYYLKSSRHVRRLAGAASDGDANGCGAEYGRKVDLVVSDDGWSGENTNNVSCGFLCSAGPSEEREAARVLYNATSVIIEASNKFGDGGPTKYRYALIDPTSMATRSGKYRISDKGGKEEAK